MNASVLFGAGWEGDCVDVLWKGADRLFCRLRCDGAEGDSHVFVPTLTGAEHSTLESIERLTHEYDLRDCLDSTWALKPVELVREREPMMLVVQYDGGEPLDRLIGQPMEIRQFLRLAVVLSAALSQLHGRGLIHKDIKPANVLVHSATGQVWLTGFGIASRLPRERQSPEPPEFIAGTLAYMAPEQTGRVNRSIDSRSDLYSLGVTFYEMLTGGLPFKASDPMEWVHCHIARQPAPPGTLRGDVPTSVSAITMKLLSKPAEERYQTAAGLESDLRRCLFEWESRGRIDDFPPGAHDAPDRLIIPEKLYGRAREVETLLASFDRVVKSGRPELVLVSGYSGIGKSAVVNELHKPLVPPRGLFASGKFDQYKRDIPYATLAQALQSLIRPLLSKSEEELSKWRNALHEALDPNGQLMVGLVPELKAVIGEQPPVPELPQQEAQRRFHLVLRRFINVFARPEHPLALFLDDLQWLDAATLDLMEDLLTQPDVKHLMLIGAYRDNEVDPAHPLVRKLQAMREAGALVQDIVLAPLNRADLERLIADSLHCEPEHAGPLAELVHDKTTGNPLFAIQFLSALFDEGLLTFDNVEGRWSWDLNRIHAKGYTDNVVDLMVGKLTRLAPETQIALKQLACLGNSAAFTMVRVAYQDSVEQVHAQLSEAVGAGFILRSKDSYHFLHDRVQEAAYSLIPEERRAEAHLRIGRLLAAHTPPGEREERIFEIVNQLNRGAALIQSPEERQQAADLNLLAGKRARVATAYASALTYFAAGRALLGDDYWERQYPLVFDLELHLAECEFLTGELASAEKRLTTLLGRAATVVHRAAVTHLRLAVYMTLDRPDRAIEVGLEYLRHVGIEWSPQPSEEDVRQELERMWRLLDGRSIEQLVDLPLMSDLGWRATMDVFAGLFAPTLLTDSNLYDLVVLRMTTLSLEHGNCDASCYAYSHINRVLGFRFGDYQTAFRFGQLACDLVEKWGLNRFEARVYASFGAFAIPWMKDLFTSRALIRRGFDMANAGGDLTYAIFGFKNLITNLLASGEPLGNVQREAEQGLAFARKARFGFAIDWFTGQLMLIRALRGFSLDFDSPDNAGYGDGWYERHLKENPPLALCTCTYWIHKLQASVLAQDHPAAIEAVANASALLWSTRSFLEAADYHFYGALTQAAACDSAGGEERAQHFDGLLNHHRQLSVWAENCPETFANRAALVSAEIARLEGRDLEAMRFYEEAIRSARDHRFIQNEGIANELAARFYATRDFGTIANTCLRNARYCYLRWGAEAKVRQMDQLYPHLGADRPLPDSTATILAPVEHLDLATVIKVSEAVSGEIVLEKLIDTLMRTAIEHAGAERGLLILPRGGEYRIEAEATTGSSGVKVELRQTSITAADLPESVFRYALRTQECVLLHDASGQSSFSADEYVREHHARSVLCLPLLRQTRLLGVLYLENNLTQHAFTPARMAVLKLLASAAAISMENTRLYGDLKEREARVRRLVDSNIVGIIIWNLDGCILEANEAFLNMTGYDRSDLLSGRLRWTDLTPADWAEADKPRVAEVLATGIAQPFEKEYLRKDGTRVPVLVGAAIFDGAQDEGVAFVIDLSARKRAEEQLALLQTITVEVAAATDLSSALEVVLRRVCEETGWAFGQAWLPRRDGTALESGPVWARDRGEMEEFAAFSKSLPLAPGSGLPGRVWSSRRPAWIQDVTRDANFPRSQVARESGLKAALGIPIVSGSEVTAVIEFFLREPRREDEQLVKSITTVAAQLDMVIERKQAEEKLRESERSLRLLTEAIPQLIWSATPDGAIDYCNRPLLEYAGKTMEEMSGDGWVNFLHPEEVSHVTESWRTSVETGGPFEVETRLRSADGRFRWFVSRGLPLRDGGGAIIRWYGTCTDMDDWKRAEGVLRETQGELAHLNRVMTVGELTSSIAHEINQPLAAIVMNGNACLRWLALDPPEVAKARASAESIIRDGERASQVISRIRALLKKSPPTMSALDVGELAREVIGLTRHEMVSNKVILRTDLETALPPVSGDRIQLQQVMINLTVNAVEAMRGVSDGRRELLIAAVREGGGVRVSVSDAGGGFDPRDAEHLFDAFYTTKPEGMGMGLAISRSIVEAHGGRLWAESNERGGATFHFTLPGAEGVSP